MVKEPIKPNIGNNAPNGNQDDSPQEDTAQMAAVNLDQDSVGGGKSVTINVYTNRKPFDKRGPGGASQPPMGGAPYPPMGGAPYPPMGGTPQPPMGGTPQPPMGGAPYPPMGGAPQPPMGGVPHTPIDDEETNYEDILEPTPQRTPATHPKGSRFPERISLQEYDCIRKLAEGGQGAVYLCEKKDTRQVNAIKVLNTSMVQASNLEDNFQIIDKLNHPNICKIRDHAIDWSSARWLLIMEYIDGEDLSHWKKRFPNGVCPLDELLPIVKQCAEALDFVHRKKNVIHKDIKPSNIMLERETGDVKLLDFGLADSIDTTMIDKGYRSLGGTPQYMSPEQLRENLEAINSASKNNANLTVDRTAVNTVHKNLTGRSDQYSLAVTIYSLLSGTLPFASVARIKDDKSDPNQVYYQTRLLKYQTEWDYVPIPNVPKHVNAALKRALHPKPSHRFDSCMDFYHALENDEKKPMPISVGTIASVLGAVVLGAILLLTISSYFFFGKVKDDWDRLKSRLEESKHIRSWQDNEALDSLVKNNNSYVQDIEEEHAVWRVLDIRPNNIKLDKALSAREEALGLLADANRVYEEEVKPFEIDKLSEQDEYRDEYREAVERFRKIKKSLGSIDNSVSDGDKHVLIKEGQEKKRVMFKSDAYSLVRVDAETINEELKNIKYDFSLKHRTYLEDREKVKHEIRKLERKLDDSQNKFKNTPCEDDLKALKENNLRELKDSIKENSIGDNGKITHYPALQDAVNDLHSIGKDIETSYEKYNQLEDEVNKYIEAVKRIKFFSDVANALLKQCYWLDENILEKNDLPDNRKAKLDELKESLKDIKGKQSVETSRQLAKECATMYKTLIDDWLLHIKESVAGAQAALKSLKEVEEHRNLKNALEEAKGFLASIEEVRRLRPDYLKENDFSGILKKEQESLKKLADEKISFEGMLRAVQKQNEFAQLDNELRPLRDRMNDAERDGVSKANDAQKHFDAGHYKEAAEDWKKAVEAYEAFERRNKGDIDNLRKNVKASIQKVRECLVKTQGIVLETGDEAKINDARKQCDAAEGLLGRNEQTVEELANTGENLKKDEERLHGILAAAQARARRQEFEKLDEELQLYRNEMTAAEKDGIAKAAGAQKAFEAGRFEDAERLWGDAIRAYRDFDERTRPTLAEVEKLMETIGISLGDFTKLPISKEDRETFGKWFDDARNDVEKNNLRLARRKLTETFEKMQIPWTEGWEKCCRERAVKVNVAQVVIPEDVKMGIDEARQAAKSAFDEKNYELARKSWKMACDEYERLLGPEPTLDEVAVLEKDVKGLLDTVGELPVDFEVEKAKGLSFDVASAAYKKGLADFHKQELRPARRFFQDAQGQLNELKDIREKQKERLDNYITQARTAFDMSNAVQLSKLIGDIEAIDRNHEELVVLKEKGKALQAFLNAREANENEKYDELKGALDGLNKGYLDRHKDEIELLEKIWTAYKDLKPVQKTFNTDTLEKAAAMLGIKPGSKMAQDIRDNCFETIWQNAKKASDEGKYDLFKGYLDTLNEYHYTGNQDERKTLTSLMEAEREKNFSEDTLENVDKMLALKRDSKLAERLRRKCLDEIWKKANEANKNEEYRYNNNLALYLNKLETYGYKEPERGKMDELRKICKAADELKSALREKDNSARLDKAVDLLNLKKGISAWAAGIREDCLGDMFRRAQEAENKEDYVRLKNVLDVLNKYRFDEKRMNNLLKIQKAYDDMMNENKVMTTAMNEGKDGVREAKSTLKEAEKLIALRNGHSEKANGVRVVCWLAILNPLFENARRMDKENKDYKTTWQGLKKQVKEYLDALNGPDPKLQEKMDECDKKLNDVIVPPPPPAPQPQPQPQPIALDKRVVLGNGVEIKLVKLKVSENSSENLWVAEGRMTGSQYAALLNSVQWRLTKEEKDVFKQLYGENVKAKDSFTWDEAWNWCNLLNRVSSESVPAGCQFRLPTKSEWEACRKQSWKFGMRTDMGEWCLDAVVDKQQPIQFPAPRGYVVSLGKDGGKRETKSVIRVVMMGDGKQLGSRAEYFLRIKGTRENPNEVLKFVDGSDRVKLSTFKSAPVTFRVVLGPVVPFK